jgi:uncharacterized integral membrane protein
MASVQSQNVEATESPDPAPVSPAESRAQRLARHGHRARLYASAVALVALLAVLVVLISKNTGAVKLDWAIGSTHASLVWIILAAAIIGWLLGIATAAVFRHRTRRPQRPGASS